MNDLRKDCQMRHENGNCNVIGGFCTAVNDSICAGLHNAYDCGYYDGEIRAKREQEHKCPCDLCGYGPPSGMNGKPCTMCPAIPKEDNILDYLQKSAEEADHV